MNIKLIGAAAIVVIAGGAGFWVSQQGGESVEEAAMVVPSDSTPDIAPDGSGVIEMVLGADDAPITMVEYASYTCPHCASFHQGAFKDIKAEYIDTGKVKFIYREVYFDRPGLWASIVARCGGPVRFFGISDVIYEKQREWARQSDPSLIAAELRKIGRAAGMSNEQLDACLSDETKAEKLVAWYEANAREDDIRSTPSFVINGQRHSNMNIADFRALLDRQLGG